MRNLSQKIFRTGNKEFMTESENQQSPESAAETKRKKKQFNVRQMMETMQEQKQKNCKALILKLLLFVIAGS